MPENKYIEIFSKEDDRRSTLVIEDDGTLGVMGELPHRYKFEPDTVACANKLIVWLKRWRARAEGKTTRTFRVKFGQTFFQDVEVEAVDEIQAKELAIHEVKTDAREWKQDKHPLSLVHAIEQVV